eukprot:TRINITY_DN3846_c1_g1_i1.p1 TRINITY_DN3846_c1_g1~~TRINITY_DN3846_c1_g1_i1.p1  ORF type:complete len:862 (+),score=339.37 TRINITY_DN3846_c1_g1_i1:79-2664(+)
MDPVFDDGLEGNDDSAPLQGVAAGLSDPTTADPAADPAAAAAAAAAADPAAAAPAYVDPTAAPLAAPVTDPMAAPTVVSDPPSVPDPHAAAQVGAVGGVGSEVAPALADPTAVLGPAAGLPPMPGMPGLRRTTSGITGTTAPAWENVEGAQSEMTNFLRRMFDTMGQQHQALQQLQAEMRNMRTAQYEIQVVNEENQRVYHDTQQQKMEDQMQSMQEQEQKLRLQRNAVEDQTAELRAQADRLEKIESDLGMKIQLAEDRAAATAMGLESRLNEFGTKTDETLARLDDDRSRLGHEVAQSFSREQIEKKTLRQLVHELALQHNKLCDIAKRERYGRLRLTGWVLADLNLKGVCRRFYQKWRSWTKMGHDLRQAVEGKETYAMVALTGIRRDIHRRYFNKLKLFVEWARKQHVKADRCCKAIRRLNYGFQLSILRRYYGKFGRYMDLVREERREFYSRSVELATGIQAISHRTLLRRYYDRIVGLRRKRAARRAKVERYLTFLNRCDDSLRQKYYDRVKVFYQWRKYQRQRLALANDLLEKTNKNVRRRYLERWARHAAMIRRFLERAAVSRALQTKNQQVLRREYWFLWSRYQRLREMQRERQETDNRFAEANRKTDNLSVQIDVGLKTLSNTNSVLNKLVDRLISVDSQLDILDKEKISRRELSLVTDPTRHPELEEPPPRKPKRMTANDPRTSPAPEPKPFDDYKPVVMQGSTARQVELERERELEQMQERQHNAEMENSAAQLEHLAHTVSQLGTPHTIPDASAAVPPHGHSLPTLPSALQPSVHSSFQNYPPAPQHPQQPSYVTPPAGHRHADVTPGATSNASQDLAMQMRAEFDRELQAQRSSYRQGGLNAPGRFL